MVVGDFENAIFEMILMAGQQQKLLARGISERQTKLLIAELNKEK